MSFEECPGFRSASTDPDWSMALKYPRPRPSLICPVATIVTAGLLTLLLTMADGSLARRGTSSVTGVGE